MTVDLVANPAESLPAVVRFLRTDHQPDEWSLEKMELIVPVGRCAVLVALAGLAFASCLAHFTLTLVVAGLLVPPLIMVGGNDTQFSKGAPWAMCIIAASAILVIRKAVA
jgi:hypothetical protein